MTLLTQEEVAEFLQSNAEWQSDGSSIERTYEFADFNEAISFVIAVAEEAEAADHHPDIDIRWNKVTLSLSTHSEGGITQLDLDLAEACDELAAS